MPASPLPVPVEIQRWREAMQEPLRVLFLVMRPQRRGAEIFAGLLARELERRGATVRILYLYGAADDGLPLGETDVLLGGNPAHWGEKTIGFSPSLLRRVMSQLDEFRPDVVQANGARSLKYGALACRLARRSIPFVYRNIGDARHWAASLPHRLFYRRVVMPRVDGIVSVSEASLDSLRKTHRVTGRARVIPRAVSPEELIPGRSVDEVRQSLATPLNAPVVIYVGNLSAEKRLDRWLRVAAKVRRRVPDARFWFVGAGPERPRIEAEIAAHGLGQACSLIGETAVVADYLVAADLLLLTSDSEGTPGVVLEAQCLGKPVVATAVGGVASCLTDGETGYLASPDDEDALAVVAGDLCVDPDLRHRMGAAGAKLIRSRFLIDAAAEQYLEFYGELASGPPAPPAPLGSAKS